MANEKPGHWPGFAIRPAIAPGLRGMDAFSRNETLQCSSLGFPQSRMMMARGQTIGNRGLGISRRFLRCGLRLGYLRSLARLLGGLALALCGFRRLAFAASAGAAVSVVICFVMMMFPFAGRNGRGAVRRYLVRKRKGKDREYLPCGRLSNIEPMLAAVVAGCCTKPSEEQPLCPPSNNAEPTPPSTKCSGRTRTFRRADPPCFQTFSRSWAALAHQLESLRIMDKDEEAASHSGTGARGTDEQRAL